MRRITVTVTGENGALLGSKTFRVPDDTKRLEVVDADPAEGPYKPLAVVRIGAPKAQPKRRPRRGG